MLEAEVKKQDLDTWAGILLDHSIQSVGAKTVVWYMAGRVLVLGRFDSRAQSLREIAEYIDAYYNQIRLYSSLDYVSPVEYERKCKSARLAA